jgi:hypothetical protein
MSDWFDALTDWGVDHAGWIVVMGATGLAISLYILFTGC